MEKVGILERGRERERAEDWLSVGMVCWICWTCPMCELCAVFVGGLVFFTSGMMVVGCLLTRRGYVCMLCDVQLVGETFKLVGL